MIEEYAKELKALNDKVKGARIIAHDLFGSAVRVTYDNGVRVYVNYGESAATLDQTTLEPMTYKVLQ